jgi:nucleoside-diphosphate-sugar epimerase
MPKIFVTGGSGFLGGRLIETLTNLGNEVIALARSDAAAQAVAGRGATPVSGNLTDPAGLTAAMAGSACVFHCAGIIRDWGDEDEVYRANVEGTKAVIIAARRAGVPRLIHTSSISVLLGGSPLVRADETAPYPPRPVGLYAKTKGIAERSMLAANSRECEIVVVRPRALWGRGDTTVLPRLAAAVKMGRFMWLDEGKPLTSTCHVDNAVEGLLLAARQGRAGEMYFLDDGEPIRVRDFFTSLLATQRLLPVARSLSFPAARRLAGLAEMVWRALRLKTAPPLDRPTVALLGQESTSSDAKARRDLGYAGLKSREQGLLEIAMSGGTMRREKPEERP